MPKVQKGRTTCTLRKERRGVIDSIAYECFPRTDVIKDSGSDKLMGVLEVTTQLAKFLPSREGCTCQIGCRSDDSGTQLEMFQQTILLQQSLKV